MTNETSPNLKSPFVLSLAQGITILSGCQALFANLDQKYLKVKRITAGQNGRLVLGEMIKVRTPLVPIALLSPFVDFCFGWCISALFCGPTSHISRTSQTTRNCFPPLRSLRVQNRFHWHATFLEQFVFARLIMFFGRQTRTPFV